MRFIRAYRQRIRMAKTIVMCRYGDCLQQTLRFDCLFTSLTETSWYRSEYGSGSHGSCIRRQECAGRLLETKCIILTHCEKSLLLLKIHRRFHNIKICSSRIVSECVGMLKSLSGLALHVLLMILKYCWRK